MNTKESDSQSGIQGSLVHEFINAYVLATSPDGKRICLYFTTHPQEPFTWRAGWWKRDNKEINPNDMLRVIEVGSWKTIHSAQLRQKAFHASFFSGGEQLYVETLAFRKGADLVSQQVMFDLQSGRREERLRPEHPNESFTYYFALQDRTLLATEVDGESRGIQELILAKLPDYSAIARASFPVSRQERRERYGHDTDIFISDDRQTVAYGTDHAIVYRRTADLGILWTAPIDPDFLGVWKVAISADRSRVAAAIIDTGFVEQQRSYYVGVYDARNGALLHHLPVNGYAGLAISPSGKFLAVGERTEVAKTGETRLAVSIFDVTSGKQVAYLIHDQFHIGRDEWVDSHFVINGIQFTADGKYLITSSVRTKLWHLEGLN